MSLLFSISDRLLKLEEKIKETGPTSLSVLNAPQGTQFELQVLQLVVPADIMQAHLAQECGAESIKLLYSLSDQEQAQFFASKSSAAQFVEQKGSQFFRAVFREKFTFTLNEQATDVIFIKVLAAISKAPRQSSASS